MEDLCEIRGRTSIKLLTNKVLNGNISGKELEAKKGIATGAANKIDDTKLQAIFKDTDSEEIKKLGEGTFEIKIATDATTPKANVTVELFDNSEFNGGKKYLMDSFTFQTGDNDTNETFNIAGIELELNINKANLEANKGVTITFSNEVKVEEEGIRLQVGANREQMIGLSVGNMRSRELGLGGIDVIGVGNAEEAIERIDEAISRVSSQRAVVLVRQRKKHILLKLLL